MMETVGWEWYAGVLLLVPAAGALLAATQRRRAADLVAIVFTLGAVVALLALTGVFSYVGVGSPLQTSVALMPWLSGAAAQFGLLVDGLSVIMLVVAVAIGLLVVLFSTEYLSPRNREHCPEVPMCGYLNLNHGGNDRRVGFDLPGMFETLDIFTYHTYRPRSWQPMNRCMDSLRKAYPDTALGVLEWGAALVNNPQLCDEECYKANGLAMLFDSMAWGQSLHDLWRGIGTGAAAGDNWPEPRLGNTVLRYSTTHMPLSMARIRRVGRVALEYPTVQPDVAILEVTSSFFNALPTSLYYLGPRLWMGEIAAALEEEGWNYGYLWERLLLEGKQSVQGIQTIVVPLGYCCPPELAEKLIAWVRDGGRLILVGPCGIWDQYGRPDNRLLSAAFGDADWTQQTARSWTPSSPDVRPSNEEAGVYQAALGRGTVLLFGDLDHPFPMDELMRAVAANTRSTIHCSNPDFKLVLREAPDAYYLYVVNTGARPLEQASEGEITLTRAISEAADLGLHKPVSVPLTQAQGVSRFTIRLAQGEGALVRLTR